MSASDQSAEASNNCDIATENRAPDSIKANKLKRDSDSISPSLNDHLDSSRDFVHSYDITTSPPSFIYSDSLDSGSYYREQHIEIRSSPEPDINDPRLERIRFDTESDPFLGDLFYDDLSKIFLTRGALAELDRRNSIIDLREQADLLAELLNNPNKPENQYDKSQERDLQQLHLHPTPDLLIYASKGVPGLEQLRGCRFNKHPLDIIIAAAMAGFKPKHQWSKDHVDELGLQPTKSSNPRDNNFKQNLDDHRIIGVSAGNPKPNNLPAIREAARQPRAPLYPALSLEAVFEIVHIETETAEREANTHETFRWIDEVPKGYTNHPWGIFQSDRQAEDYMPLTNGQLVPGSPDRSWASHANSLELELRQSASLKYFIMPNRGPSYPPIVPNFICHLKGKDYEQDTLRSQALYDGALAARGMHALRLYTYGDGAWDNNSYTITSTFAGGALKLYCMFIRKNPTTGRTEYFMNSIIGPSLGSSPEELQLGVTAYRNLVEWARDQRNALIEAANKTYRTTKRNSSPALDAFYQQCRGQIKYFAAGPNGPKIAPDGSNVQA